MRSKTVSLRWRNPRTRSPWEEEEYSSMVVALEDALYKQNEEGMEVLWVRLNRAPAHDQERIAIYGLIDPRTGNIRYIGQTNSPYWRIQGHIVGDDDKGKPSPKDAWIRELINAGLEPKMLVLAWVPEHFAYWAELEYIKAARRAGADLLNVTENTWAAREQFQQGVASQIKHCVPERSAPSALQPSQPLTSHEATDVAHNQSTPLVACRPGDQVLHKIFGVGIVQSVHPSTEALILFHDARGGEVIRRLDMSLAPLSKI